MYTAGGALFLLLAACLLVIFPFISSFLWATILCFSAWPLYRRLLSKLGDKRRTLAAAIMSIGIVTVLLLPFVVIAFTLADNLMELSNATIKWVNSLSATPPTWLAEVPLVGSYGADLWQELGSDTARLWQYIRTIAKPLSSGIFKGGVHIMMGLAELTLSVFFTFFLFRDGVQLAGRLVAAVNQLAGERGKRLLDVAGKTVRSVVQGILGTALVQAVMAGVGFLIAGVPGASVLALLTFFLSVVPMGPPLVWLPAAAWLFHSGQVGWAVFMLIWGVGVSSVDNVVKPMLISQGANMPFILILLGVLGGAMAFGFIGVFLGPTLLAVGYRIIAEWTAGPNAVPLKEAKPPESQPDTQPA